MFKYNSVWCEICIWREWFQKSKHKHQYQNRDNLSKEAFIEIYNVIFSYFKKYGNCSTEAQFLDDQRWRTFWKILADQTHFADIIQTWVGEILMSFIIVICFFLNTGVRWDDLMVPSGPMAKWSLYLTVFPDFSQTLFTRPLGKEVSNGEEFYRAGKGLPEELFAVDSWFFWEKGMFAKVLKYLLNFHYRCLWQYSDMSLYILLGKKIASFFSSFPR